MIDPKARIKADAELLAKAAQCIAMNAFMVHPNERGKFVDETFDLLLRQITAQLAEAERLCKVMGLKAWET